MEYSKELTIPQTFSSTIELSVFAALQHRNFRLLWWGLLISFSGSFMQGAALLWHVSLLVPDDRRALALGLVGLTRIGPILLFSLVSGVAADALDRRKLMLRTQSIMAALAAILRSCRSSPEASGASSQPPASPPRRRFCARMAEPRRR